MAPRRHPLEERRGEEGEGGRGGGRLGGGDLVGAVDAFRLADEAGGGAMGRWRWRIERWRWNARLKGVAAVE